jgi:hypothetical protein
MTRIRVLPALDVENYQRSALHSGENLWVEKNCYVDVWIEVIHSLGLEPRAILPFVAAIDFEGDQWTFYKPPHDEMRDLYGMDIQELNVWRPLIEHALEHLSNGRMISTEADAWYLPDTSGTDYRTNHVKSTIVLADLDMEQRRLGYFHNAAYHMLEGEDFVKTFRLDVGTDPLFLPFFAESLRIDSLLRRPQAELVRMSKTLWQKHLLRAPASNPVERFAQRFDRELPLMHDKGLGFYHAWAFATTRQLGSAFELAARNLQWLRDNDVSGLDESIQAFETIASVSKTFILKGARAVNARKKFDGTEMFAGMAAAWATGMGLLKARFG